MLFLEWRVLICRPRFNMDACGSLCAAAGTHLPAMLVADFLLRGFLLREVWKEGKARGVVVGSSAGELQRVGEGRH